MQIKKTPMGWNTWNTFGKNINEKLIMEVADAMVEKGYLDAGYEYLIIDDDWHLGERINGKQVPNPELFPHGMKYISDYIHNKGLKFGMYTCAGVMTCDNLPGSFGYEYEDAKQFAEWGVDYLKYDFCHFPKTANAKMAYATISMALRNCGRDILLAACNWGMHEPHLWMRSRGVHTYRSTQDISDNTVSFCEIFESQLEKISLSGNGFFNDMDMLTVGMHGKGNVALGGCEDNEYRLHFAIWAFMASPLIIGGDIRNLDETSEILLKNKNLIALNQDSDALPPFLLGHDGVDGKLITMARFLSGGRFAIGIFNIGDDGWKKGFVSFSDIGIPSNSGIKVELKDAVTGENMGVYSEGYQENLEPMHFRIVIGGLLKNE